MTIGSKSSCTPNHSIILISKRSCFFLLSFIIFIVLVLGFAAFLVFVVIKPEKPVFSVQTANLESYELGVVPANKDLLLSSLVSFTLKASNPNKFGLSYGSSRLQVLENGTVIGMIKVPRFDQPPKSNNISLEGQVILQCLNVNQMIAPAADNGHFMQENNDDDGGEMFQIMRVLGDIGVQISLFRMALPKLRIALDCGIKIDPKHLTLNSRMTWMKLEEAAMMSDMAWFKDISLPTVSKLFSKKCSFAVYI